MAEISADMEFVFYTGMCSLSGSMHVHIMADAVEVFRAADTPTVWRWWPKLFTPGSLSLVTRGAEV